MRVIGPRFRERNSEQPASGRVQSGSLNIYQIAGRGAASIVAPYAPTWAYSGLQPSLRERVWDETHPGPPFTTGGPFASVKIERPELNIQGGGTFLSNVFYHEPNGWVFGYEGGFYDPLWLPILDSVPEGEYNSLGQGVSTLFPDLTSIGAGAYARLRPQLSHAGLGQALVEMRDLPKMLSTTAKGFSDLYKGMGGVTSGVTTRAFRSAARRKYGKMAPKNVANQFVNQQFGWVPFLNDLYQTFDTYQNARKYKSQIARDNGSWIKRKRADRQIESKTVVYTRTDHPGCQPFGYPFSGMYDSSSFNYTITLIEYTDVWYEGSFKYYRPEFDWDSDKSKGLFAALKRELAIYGADLDPVLVWKVTPWSWMIDWFTNTGDAIQRAQDWATDSIVSKYMYLMHRRRRIFELRSRFTTMNGQHHDYVWYRSADIKRRIPADSPFEFSLSGGDLSLRQSAILGALGIGRLPR